MNKRNFYGFLWHALWFAFTSAFTDYNTVLPALIVKAGGGMWHIGVLTFISIGVPLASQLLFTPFIETRPQKKPFLLLGINLRIVALAGIGFTIYWFLHNPSFTLFMINVYLWMLFFTFSGAFAGLSYTHLLGLSFEGDERKHLIVSKQVLSAIGLALSATAVTFILRQKPYPGNYMQLFFMASGMLLVASAGFWLLNEKTVEIKKNRTSILNFLKRIPQILRDNKNLTYLIVAANLLSASMILIPFITGSLKGKFEFSGSLIGNLLIFQYAGMIVSNWIWKKIVKRKGFKGLLKMTALLIGSMPPMAYFILQLNMVLPLYFFFFLVGSGISAFKIAIEGGLLEISTNENRVLFTGVFGATNLISSLFPLLTGLLFYLISPAFILFAFGLISLSALFFIKKLNCPVD
ncbi:MFS transporter [Calditrichota bacterium GD2]